MALNLLSALSDAIVAGKRGRYAGGPEGDSRQTGLTIVNNGIGMLAAGNTVVFT